jgi:serine/threonine-protein kinase
LVSGVGFDGKRLVLRAEAERLIRRLDATPTEQEAERLYQARLRQYAGLLASIFGGLYAAGIVITLVIAPGSFVPVHIHPAKLANLAMFLIAAAVYVLTRKEERAPAWLLVAGDFVLPVATTSLVLGVALGSALGLGLYMVPLLLLALVIVSRAALIPSAPQRTAAVGVLAAVPAVIAAHIIALRSQPLPGFATPGLVMLGAGAWSLAMVGCSVLISKVIYGLHRQIESVRRLGQYVLGDLLGEGGMGAVYRAEHALLRRPTAVKLLLPERTGPDSLQRFEREVQRTAQLTHPNTVAIYDYGHTSDGVFYYAMELLDGLTLEELVRRHGPLPPGRVVHVLCQAASALAEAHALGLIHRDIKPANLVLCERGGLADTLKIVDFGLVKSITPGSDPALTRENSITGTPLYMAPEAITDPNTVDERVDLYALGAVGYFLLTGSPPFEAKTVVEICGHHLHSTPAAPSQRLGAPIPRELEALILACLSKDKNDRPASAQALEEALAECARTSPWTAAEARAFWREFRAGRSSATP